ncbi:hypothetical protein Bp8pC_021 [Bacillus phage Bp8p-C]|uniref:Uncharacterized protein n=2 Tax=Agatevirus Bp8pC TaxID=1910937 RepID=A0A0A0PLE2_9CAUD|nr:hypothetical protein AXJ20_gp021 [Bacillus phage Bp8p-C]YP_009784322.1 hypothetical protein QLX39_gp021 [Bacillus phage Bp8p-T]AHJ87452.1 hypothetical protein Bp8pC_021 [Bacillus phage Bp8p-C]AHJ87663.1 hypothetical protein Bp8pT_021 [Bacillus phage Bp8p-T]
MDWLIYVSIAMLLVGAMLALKDVKKAPPEVATVYLAVGFVFTVGFVCAVFIVLQRLV